MRTNGLIAIPEVDSRTVGCVTWWRLSGELEYSHLEQRWVDHVGLATEFALPTRPTALACLRRALSVYEGKHTLIRPLESSGYAVVDEIFTMDEKMAGPKKRGPEYNIRFSVELELRTSGEADLEIFLPAARHNANAKEWLQGIRDQSDHAHAWLQQSDVSTWLVSILDRLQAVRLRDTGGIYFVPARRADLWHDMAGVLAACSASRIFEIPAMSSASAVEAISEALRAEAEAEVQRIDDALDGTLGMRALESRMESCKRIFAKVSDFERILSCSLAPIKESVVETETRVAAAKLTLEAQMAQI